eukprot:5020088-Prymnesium_polylepis.1
MYFDSCSCACGPASCKVNTSSRACCCCCFRSSKLNSNSVLDWALKAAPLLAFSFTSWCHFLCRAHEACWHSRAQKYDGARCSSTHSAHLLNGSSPSTLPQPQHASAKCGARARADSVRLSSLSAISWPSSSLTGVRPLVRGGPITVPVLPLRSARATRPWRTMRCPESMSDFCMLMWRVHIFGSVKRLVRCGLWPMMMKKKKKNDAPGGGIGRYARSAVPCLAR